MEGSCLIGIIVFIHSILAAGFPVHNGGTKGCDQVCQQECIGIHNIYRANHRAPALVYDQTLADQAQSLIDKGVFKHSDWAGVRGGESFAWGSLFPTFTAAIKSWHDESAAFNFEAGKPRDQSQTVRHFAQVVWSTSRKAGCARGQLYGQPWYVVQYDKGPLMDTNELKQNVKPPNKDDRKWFQKSSPFANELQVVAQV